MSERRLHVVVELIRQKSYTDPHPEKRAAFEEVLDMLARVDKLDLDEFMRATAPRPLQGFPRDFPIITREDKEREELHRALLRG